ncbi:hypothetical protein AO260_28925 [Pseudomonas sp. ABAC21]|nr:hypothetical protein AO260_28925 [Pseudomonas sp. ABAC21]
MATGALNYADSNWFKGASPADGAGAKVTTAGPVQNPGYSSDWLSWPKAQDAVLRGGTHAVIESGISTAINGGSLKDNLGSALVSQGFDLAAAAGNKGLGNLANDLDLSPGSAEKVLMHAILGGALSAARGGDFKTGAIAAGAAEGLTAIANENVGKYLDERFAKDDQFKVATAQIIGIAAGSLVNGNPNDAAWVAGNVERYNEQLHPRAVKLIKEEAPRFAAEMNISIAEAERRLAQGLVYFSDKNWNKVLNENGNVPDKNTLDYLGRALTPIAAEYAGSTSSDVPSTQADRTYTPAETSNLLVQFPQSNPKDYADPSVNSINFQGAYTGDLSYEYYRFYDKNIAVSYDLTRAVKGGLAGTWQGAGAAVSNAVGSIWSLLSSPAQSSEQLTNGMMGLTKNPVASLWDSLEQGQSKEALATAYQMQGNNEAAAAIRNQANAEFGLSIAPAVGGTVGGKLVEWTAGRWPLRTGTDVQGGKFIFRSDNDFNSPLNDKGYPKAHINSDGDLVPPNIDGTGSVQTHIRGSNPANSPYISATDPLVAGEVKDYGSHQIAIDIERLQKDIDAGKLSGTEILESAKVQAELQAKLDRAQQNFDANPTRKNTDKLESAARDLRNATRDGECLIKGCVPSGYFNHVK